MGRHIMSSSRGASLRNGFEKKKGEKKRRFGIYLWLGGYLRSAISGFKADEITARIG